MRLELITDDGEVVQTWSFPDVVTAEVIDEALCDGLHRHHQLDRCDRCGGFFEPDALIEMHSPIGPEAFCQTCAPLPY